ncbi:MAG TPA: 23S rRNA (guanosine(2251)-2'-O)-methyltransferase RlmB [Candidatus Alectryocaccomicrobium excrementavium]|uniref:23S rRNA (Guanosine(2251)-2'-O)-methyltransferase RlmB n=1 Tax=Candidatus Alectryocaccomicrobium excrementavium TaxID=2840668 RepID=A0A9D1G228_9FIRM|nr:23S rRNA (guanosine(2251)-2'-O)-methyltransferase RlmB [Candidatus Alectryocaccomicrobium excrementavium]
MRRPGGELPENWLAGRNPIREALRSGRPLEKLIVARGDLSGAAREIVRMAREAGVVVQEVDRARLDAMYPSHQGMIAYASAAAYSSLEDMFAAAEAAGEAPFFVALDGVTDPHNLGAVIRSAVLFGAHGVIVPKRRSAGLSPACEKAAAGALAYARIARVTNLTQTIEALKERGIWVAAAAADGEAYSAGKLSGAICLVIGSEGEGVSRLVRQACDFTVSIPTTGVIDSLNASVAAGILMSAIYEGRAKR